jgi:uncharacterized membrane protein YraQ (UPF0718 family)
MREILTETITILNESAVWLLLGFLLAGVLHVVLSRFPQITAMFTGGGQRPVYLSALLGLPMPLCSCGVLPAAMTLRRKGASKGATASFLISVPETDIVSILLTFALLGGVMAFYRPAAALITAVVAGLAINFVDRRLHEKHMAEHHGGDEKSCCCHNKPKDEGLMATTEGPWWKRVLHYGFVQIFDDIVAQLFLGILVAGVLMAWLPDVEMAQTLGSSVWSYAIMLVIGVPVYVCAVASTPVAAGLIAGGLSPGAAMVFLLAGPATNIASLFVLKGEFGKRILALYLVAIGAGSVLLGVLFDLLLGGTVTATAVAEKHQHHGSSPLEIGATVLFLLLILSSFKRTNIIRRMKNRLAGILRLAPRGTQQ